MRSASLRLMQATAERSFRDAISLGKASLAQYRMSHSIASQVRLEISICLDNLGHDNEANYERRLAFACLDKPPRDALGWLVQGRLFDAEHRHADAIGSYETVFKMPFFERKMVQRDTSFQLCFRKLQGGSTARGDPLGRMVPTMRYYQIAPVFPSQDRRKCMLDPGTSPRTTTT